MREGREGGEKKERDRPMMLVSIAKNTEYYLLTCYLLAHTTCRIRMRTDATTQW